MATPLRNFTASVGLTALGRQQCPFCGVALQETVTGKRPTPKGDACADCYFGEISEGLEIHPIASGRVRRG